MLAKQLQVGRIKVRINILNGYIEKHKIMKGLKSKAIYVGARGSVVVEALCYKPESHWFETR
jgi:hypothetical protein